MAVAELGVDLGLFVVEARVDGFSGAVDGVVLHRDVFGEERSDGHVGMFGGGVHHVNVILFAIALLAVLAP